ncbi:MAG: hypothetical protein MUO67_11915 [Anaerolineales bacterium]|nr:hypothetical protein [Anaerolineales bacterium]
MTPTYLSATPRWMRLLALVLGITLLLWFPVEEISQLSVVLFAALISAWFALRALLPVQPGERYYLVRHLLVGALAGLAVAPLAFLLMALKTGLHSHSAPDFTFEQIQVLLFRTPLWVIVGLLLGLGGSLFHLARTR